MAATGWFPDGYWVEHWSNYWPSFTPPTPTGPCWFPDNYFAIGYWSNYWPCHGLIPPPPVPGLVDACPWPTPGMGTSPEGIASSVACKPTYPDEHKKRDLW